MSRNSTSGLSDSSAARTSRPFLHSPTTTNCANGVSSCRTPRRAAGSSSATSTFHLGADIGDSHDWKFMEGNPQSGNRSTACCRRQLQLSPIAVERTQSLASVGQPVPIDFGAAVADAWSIISHRDFEHVAVATCRYGDSPRIRAARDAVTNRVFDEMLDGERWYCSEQRVGVNVERRTQSIGEPRAFDLEIFAHQLELVLESHFVLVVATQRQPQHIAQLFHHPRRTGIVAFAHQHRDGVQRVEEKMRIELRLE